MPYNVAGLTDNGYLFSLNRFPLTHLGHAEVLRDMARNSALVRLVTEVLLARLGCGETILEVATGTGSFILPRPSSPFCKRALEHGQKGYGRLESQVIHSEVE